MNITQGKICFQRRNMSKEEVCEKVKQMCEEAKIDFLFITENQSCWSIKKSSKHIRDVAKYHKENE